MGELERDDRALDPDLLERSRKRQGTRMRKYVCPGCGQILRAATDDLQVLCTPCSSSTGTPVAYHGEGGRTEVQPAEDSAAG